MARDVEFDVVAGDKTGPGLASAEAKFKRSQRQVEDGQNKSLSRMAKATVDAVGHISPKLAASLSESFAGSAGTLLPALGAAAVGAAPLIGATISAAISAGAAVGAAGIGVALVSQDARVKAAGTLLGKSLLSGLQQDASPFIGPVLKAIDTIQAKFDDLRPVIRNIFANSAQFVGPLTAGVTKAVDGITRGVDTLVAKSKPVVDALGAAIGNIGVSFGHFLASINAKEAADSITLLGNAIAGLLEVLGPVLNVLTRVYNVANKLGLTGVIGFLSKLGGASKDTAAATGQLDTAFQAATEDTYDYEAGLAAANAAVQQIYSSQRDLYGSTTAVGKAFAAANKAVKENGRTLDANTPKGQANRDALLSLASALQANYDGYVKVNGAGAGASALASNLRAKFIALATKMTGSKDAAVALANKLLGIPNVNRRVDVQTAAAAAAADALKRKLAGIKNRQVYVNVAFNEGRINSVEARLARLGGTMFGAATPGFEATTGGDGARTGGPAAVTVNQSLNVSLDGAPFRAYTARQIRQSSERDAWRQKVGQR